MPQGKFGQGLDVALQVQAAGDQHVIRVAQLAGEACVEQGREAAHDLLAQGRDAVQIVLLLGGVDAVLLKQLGMQDLLMGPRHAQPYRQRLLMDHGARQGNVALQVGRRCAADQVVHAVLKAAGVEFHRA